MQCYSMPRPTKYKGISANIVQKLKEAFRNDFTVEEACAYAGISKQTYYNWEREFSEFLDEMQRAQMFLRTEAKKILKKALLSDPNFKNALKFLERRMPAHYSSKHCLEGENNDIQINITRVDARKPLSLQEPLDESDL
ncbi:hypothetical protein HZA38_05035 [Candidatus Peregrinibacteria bacterium]|nr:hypothetical protein [Candidatus Peregrinibacteria bacterium]